MLTHFNQAGSAHMVDVGNKDSTERTAIATGSIYMLPNTLELIIAGNHKKGDVLGIARIAGIQGAKKTSDLIPLCHPIGLTHVSVDFEVLKESNTVLCTALTKTIGQTGVETIERVAPTGILFHRIPFDTVGFTPAQNRHEVNQPLTHFGEILRAVAGHIL